MTAAAQDLYIKGVRVETYGDPSRSAPLLFVHGGGQGSWAWEEIAPRLAQHGWYAVCLNWFDHNGSAPLDQSRALTRSLLDLILEDQTHGININPIWTQVTEKIQTWLSRLQLPNTKR